MKGDIKMEIKNLTYSKAIIEISYEEVVELENAMNLYSTAAKLQYNDNGHKFERMRRALNNLSYDMVQNLKDELK